MLADYSAYVSGFVFLGESGNSQEDDTCMNSMLTKNQFTKIFITCHKKGVLLVRILKDEVVRD